MNFHTPVLLQTALDFLNPRSGDLIIDATVGGGGHSLEILRKGARVLGIDRDPEAITYVREKFKIENLKLKIDQDLILVNANFNKIGEIAKSNGFSLVNGILFDLGTSSHQLESPARGFGFKHDGPLDMRMDPSQAIQAQDIVNNFPERRLSEIFKTYGQEKFSWSIASAICSARQIDRIETTSQLAQIIRGVYRKQKQLKGSQKSFGLGKIDPATKTFQALRIVVNSELLNLEEALPQTEELLKKGGRLVIISFHSLEDAIVKRFFKKSPSFMVLTKKPIGPQPDEILKNPRSRSAKLRAAEKIVISNKLEI